MIDAAGLADFTKDLKNPIKDYNDCINFVLCKNPKPNCYLNQCTSCPKIEEFSDHVIQILEGRNIEEVIFSAWQATIDALKKECLVSEDFVDELCDRLKTSIPHNFISKIQSKFVSDWKEHLNKCEVLVQCDFSENYEYVVQDVAQAFHYNNEQCTVHPIIFYYNSGTAINHCSIVLLSNSTTHDVAAVYIMQEILIPEIRKVCPGVKKIIYVTDGAKQHYKNRFQMMNLMHHFEDFGIEAEWHFHATTHGKEACDGVEAILKREATRASLQARPNEALLTSEALYKWTKNKFKDMQFFLYTKEKHEKTKRFLNK